MSTRVIALMKEAEKNDYFCNFTLKSDKLSVRKPKGEADKMKLSIMGTKGP